jgi:hypothetical protein
MTTNDNNTFHQIPLFGGAITVDLPAYYLDASTIRPVPDNQEVFVRADNSAGQTSIIFDLLEYVEPSNNNNSTASTASTTSHTPSIEDTDQAALDTHLADIITTSTTGEDDAVQVLQRSPNISLPRLPSGVRALALSARVRPVRGAVGVVGMLVTLVRLKKQATDLLVTVNVPGLVGGGEESEREGMVAAVRITERICASLDIKDWGLFGS